MLIERFGAAGNDSFQLGSLQSDIWMDEHTGQRRIRPPNIFSQNTVHLKQYVVGLLASTRK